MKYLLLGIAILYTTLSFSQSPDEGYFFGGFESNSQWLLYDKGLILSNQMMPTEQIIIFNSPMPLKILLLEFSMNHTCQMRF